ncbi:uncharacterized protein GGS22DRAFT_197563 [Annulohypoxylon maeteangense]|uniref:uncharacterized protein n=1 Tax=Annulohypoxylon maeteangense TaxID=1927788 RepID=UPI002007219F|nr:uncharacterized protein GGS22DRAFT_197563 [Annulohypoxylon maeteangense]KAI0880509.1 hypothetical protein GGS22DRAFT_197563 [Annulohypoxylon maeteangense]
MRIASRIALIPDSNDAEEDWKLQSSSCAVDKFDFRELFTFGTHGGNQPSRDHKTTIDIAEGAFVIPAETNEKNQGEPPFVDELLSKKLEFEIPLCNRVVSPRFAYEDLCRAAEGVKKLNAIESASFVTDAETLSAILRTVHDQLIHRNREDDDIEGMCFNIHSEHGVTFMKTLNSSQLQGPFHYAASNHLRTNVVQKYHLAGRDLRGLKELNEFKRVVSYRFGDHPLVVEDPNQVTHKLCLGLGQWASRDEFGQIEMSSESDRIEGGRYQHSDYHQEDKGPSPGSYDIFKTRDDDHDSPLVSSRDTALFPHITYNHEDDDIMRSQLWFSGTGNVLVGLLRNPKFRDTVQHTDEFMPYLCTMAEWPGFDKWLSDHQVELSMKLVHRILTYIKDTTHELSQKGIKKFYLKHSRKSDKFLTVSLGKEHGLLPEDLMSSYIATELGKLGREM